MIEYRVKFDNHQESVGILSGKYITEAALAAGIEIVQPCGGQGRCGRCVVQVKSGDVHRKSTLRLSPEDVADGYALACQTVVKGDVTVVIPEQEVVERFLTMDRMATEVQPPVGYDPQRDQSIRRICLQLPPPNMADQRDDWSRLQTGLRQALGSSQIEISCSLPWLQQMGAILREGDWQVTAVLQIDSPQSARLLHLSSGEDPESSPLLGLAIDIGTTTVSVWLIDLLTGQVLAQAAEYNRQIRCGEDVISRIIFANKNDGQNQLHQLVRQSINTLIDRVLQKANSQTESNANPLSAQQIMKATVVGNNVMIHLLLGISAEPIRQTPFIPTINRLPSFTAVTLGLDIYPEAAVFCLPGVASYVGADISAGVLASGLDDSAQIGLFMDIGTNGELVLGCADWAVACACSAGPAFEGSGVRDGMRATRGAIEAVWIDGRTFEPTLRVIGNDKPRGLCGSGLISILAELFLTGIIDKGGHFNHSRQTDRIRTGENGDEYVVAWADETWHGREITITRVDIDNLIRTKAAIYAGISVLLESVGLTFADIADRILIGGAFGKYINVENGVQIGLLPDVPWDNFDFLGNTAVLGAYYALLSQTALQRIEAIADRLTYIELSADNRFYEAFTSALFLPHTDLAQFPSVAAQMQPQDAELSV